jgi:hypothetical protein
MSAKQSKRNGQKASPAAATPVAATAAPAGAAALSGSTEQAATSFVPWIESSDPRKRMWGKIVLIAAWIYVAALWLLALDQTFHWGIFGPKIPPTP